MLASLAALREVTANVRQLEPHLKVRGLVDVRLRSDRNPVLSIDAPTR
jgi:hypothetical protein